MLLVCELSTFLQSFFRLFIVNRAFSNPIDTFRTLCAEQMLTSEMDSGERQYFTATIAIRDTFEICRCLLELCYFSLSGFDLGCFQTQLVLVLLDSFILSLSEFT